MTISLAEYIPKKMIYENKTYIDLLSNELYTIITNYLTHIDKISLEISQKKEARSITEEEIRYAEEDVKMDEVEANWYNDYDPYDKYDYQYGNGYDDFSVNDNYEDEYDEYDDDEYANNDFPIFDIDF